MILDRVLSVLIDRVSSPLIDRVSSILRNGIPSIRRDGVSSFYDDIIPERLMCVHGTPEPVPVACLVHAFLQC